MSITKEQIKHLAHLSRLELNDNELDSMQGDMEKILEFVAKIDELDLTGVEPLTQMSSSVDVMRTDEALNMITKEQALKHPNWEMGAKITIDSASLMNKGLEVIEAKWLFGIPADKIEVVVHPQSIIHSAVQFEDSSILAQMGIPSMKVPIQYALTYPERPKSNFERFSFFDYPNLTFEKPDIETFKNLKLAFEVLDMGGNSACVLNAANEITNKAFLDGKISFLQIGDINENTIEKSEFIAKPTLEDYIETNKLARKLAEDFCN